jgi:hypothetical protein
MNNTVKGVLFTAQDNFTQGIKSIDTDHHYIHQGEYYTFSDYITMLTNTTYSIGFKTPSSIYDIHIRATVITCNSDSLRMLFYENSIYSGGSNGSPLNHNRKSSNVTKMQEFKYGVTVSNAGTLLLPIYLAGATGVGQSRSGSGSATQYEWVLKQNTNYAIQFVNNSAGSNIVNYNINWYEENELI